MAKKAANYLSKELDLEVSLHRIYFKPFSSLSVQQLYVADKDSDTLLYAGQLKANFDLSSIFSSKLTFNRIELEGSKFFLKRYADNSTNLDIIIDYFSGQDKKNDDKKKLELIVTSVHLSDVAFRYQNRADSSEQAYGIRWNDISVTQFSGDFENLDFTDHLFQADIKGLALQEKSGLHIKQLRGLVTIDTNAMQFDQFRLQTNRSTVGDHLRFDFDSFEGFSDFNHKVKIDGQVVNSHISSADIAYFAPSVNASIFDLDVEGEVKGTVSDLYGKQVTIKGGKATYIVADVRIKGLPEIEHTIFDLDVRQMSSNKSDLDYLIPRFSGHKAGALPAMLASFGHINYSGSFKGYYDRFNVNGTFKTAIGSLVSNIDIDIQTKNSYKGKVRAESLNLARLFNLDELGLTSFSGDIDGSGFEVDDLQGNIDLAVSFFEFKDYRYQNITAIGTIQDKLLGGVAKVDDINLRLTANGTMDLSVDTTEYHFVSNIAQANLKPLNLYQDTLAIKGNVYTDFKGDEVNSIEGNLKLYDLVITMPSYSTNIDSIAVSALGAGQERLFLLKSDLADVRMQGEIDINTFPSYFKSIASKYIPSWDAKLLIPGRQQFDFTLRLKKAEPILMLFAPQFSIPAYAVLNGRFSNVDSVAALNGFIPEVLIGQSKISNVILDGGALENSLNMTVTADRFDIKDSLYVENINISSLLARDSLKFNIKLSDVNATNQLDLNGLVAFKENESANVGLLPSTVIINREYWTLDDGVDFDFQKERTVIKKLELVNAKQRVTLDGVISKNSNERLNLAFADFELTTFNALTQPFGVKLQGMLNGNIALASVLSNPYLAGDIEAGDVFYNDTEIGNIALLANMDTESQVINLDMAIKRQDLQTMKLIGTYNTVEEENSLNLSAQLQESEIVLFEPFLKGLVSNLEGTLSADLQISGSLDQLDINGTARLHQALMTVDYLNTRYQLDDSFAVTNSRIVLSNVKILDMDNHTALANGSVDMKTPSDPGMDVNIEANNFMVLNTTSKDNELYYGKAFGSGQFVFKGPTSKMNIDIKARSEEGTVFNIPLNATGTVSDNEFIRFVSAESDSVQLVAPASYLDGLTMHIDLAISRNTSVNIFTDMGKLSGVGDGAITMNITSLGDFEMFGDYAILQGKFDFTAQDFINKIFEINRGGTIRWTGNPSEAQINLVAVYEVRTSVRPLYTAAGRAGTDARVLAQAQMSLSGSLLHPEIGFNIAFPIDSYVKDELQSYFSDANNVNQQALSLIVRRSFAPGTGTDFTTELNSTVLSAGTELAFNQLNNIISQSLNLTFVDFNIRSLNEASASIRLWNNRLILTGGVTDRRGTVNDLNVFSNQVATDAELMYLIRRNGNLMFRASNRLNNRNFLNPNDEYISALGLVYRQEFDSVGEFLRRLFSKRDDRDTLTLPINTTPVTDPVIGNPTVVPSTAPIKGTKQNEN